MSEKIKICANCECWHRLENRDGKGECRHSPPRVFLTPGSVNKLTGHTGIDAASAWPPTPGSGWCMQWQAKVEGEIEQ